MRVFRNANNVTNNVLNARLRRYDAFGTARTYDGPIVLDGTVIGFGNFVAVDSMLTDAQIEAGLGAMTQAEINSEARFYGARDTAGLSTLLKTMTAAQAESYITNNVTNLAQAKTVLIELARLVVALRDTAWQDMQGG